MMDNGRGNRSRSKASLIARSTKRVPSSIVSKFWPLALLHSVRRFPRYEPTFHHLRRLDAERTRIAVAINRVGSSGFSEQFAPLPLGRVGIAAECMRFAEQPGDLPALRSSRPQPVLRLRSDQRPQPLPAPSSAAKACGRRGAGCRARDAVARKFGGMCFRHDHHAGIAPVLVHRDHLIGRAERKGLAKSRRSAIPPAWCARPTRIICATVRSRIQPTSAALRMVSPRRWNRQVANE